jgi:hypothetical protein
VTDNEWARTSIVVFNSNGEAAERVDIPGPTLESQLKTTERWLSERGPDMRKATAKRPGYASWSHGLRGSTTCDDASATLIEALASVGGVFWMDVYPEHD